jgi:phosphoribosylaminoimidazolecarboxamide formyltransferase/IMP cyclohydrolase
MKRILISVTDKKHLEEFKRLTNLGWEIISTGGTFKKLQELGIPCKKVEVITNFPEMMNGRVKTLHPNIFAGILADRSNPEHMAAIATYGIEPIDMVVVNLYDFKGKPGIESIDIGGPSALRAAAKNGLSCVPIVDPEDYDEVISQICKYGDVSVETKHKMAMNVFNYTSDYEKEIYIWMYHNMYENKEFLSMM